MFVSEFQIVLGQLCVRYPLREQFMSFLHFALNISMRVFLSPQISAEDPSAWVASSHSSWECVIGLSSSFFSSQP